ncbi:unnamed protein product, partial [marine sediment metagenome]
VETYASGYTLVVVRDIAKTQEVNLMPGRLNPEALEKTLDRQILALQDVWAWVEHSIRGPITDANTGSNMVIPNEIDRANKYLAFGAEGRPIASAGPSGDSSVPVSAYGETLIDDANSTEAKATLEIPTITTWVESILDDVNSSVFLATVGAANDSDVVHDTENETIAGEKTFTGIATFPVGSELSSSSDPCEDADIACKNYVDDIGGFNDRGDPATDDANEGNLTTDGEWHDLDLSSIAPAGTTAVLLRVSVQDDAASSYVVFRKNGNSNSYANALIRTQVANVQN